MTWNRYMQSLFCVHPLLGQVFEALHVAVCGCTIVTAETYVYVQQCETFIFSPCGLVIRWAVPLKSPQTLR